jgi:hypothetical protein
MAMEAEKILLIERAKELLLPPVDYGAEAVPVVLHRNRWTRGLLQGRSNG